MSRDVLQPSRFLGILVLGLSLLSWIYALSANAATDFSGWFEGASGYEKALAQHKSSKKPLFVYVYAPWCPYCQQFDENVLSSAYTRSALQNYLKVRLYPKTGPKERTIADQLGVEGYPSLYVKFANASRYQEVSRSVRLGGKTVLAGPTEFVQGLRKLAPDDSCC